MKRNAPKPAAKEPMFWWQIQGEIRSGTVNMLRILAIKVLAKGGTAKGYMIGEVAYMGDRSPEDFFKQVMLIANTAARTVVAIRGNENVNILTDGDDGLKKVIESIVKSVTQRLRTAMVNANGQRMLKVQPDGSILEVDPEDVVVEGADPDGVPELDLGDDDRPENVADAPGPHLKADPSPPKSEPGRPTSGSIIVP